MKTIIKVSPSELNESLLDKIKKIIGSTENAKIIISIHNRSEGYLRKESRDEYFDRLNESLEQLEKGNVVSFTAEEFENFSRQTLNEPAI